MFNVRIIWKVPFLKPLGWPNSGQNYSNPHLLIVKFFKINYIIWKKIDYVFPSSWNANVYDLYISVNSFVFLFFCKRNFVWTILCCSLFYFLMKLYAQVKQLDLLSHSNPITQLQHFIIIGRHTELLIAYSALRQNHNNGFQQWSRALPHINLQLNRP